MQQKTRLLAAIMRQPFGLVRMRALMPRAIRSIAVVAAIALMASLTGAQTVNAETTTTPVAATVDLQQSANFGHHAKGLRTTIVAKAVAFGPALVVSLPADADGQASEDSSGVVLNGPTADGKFTQVVAGADAVGGGFGFVTDQHGIIEERLPVRLMAGTTLRATPDGGLEQVTGDGAVLGVIHPASAVDESMRKLPASYTFDGATSTLMVRADTTSANGATFIDPSWSCVKAIASLVGWANAFGLAAWAASMILTGGASAVIGFLVWQGVAAWRTYGVIQACR